MTYRAGDFVDCAFPFREQPDRPQAQHLHIAYIVRVARRPDGAYVAALYTTTARLPSQPRRKGEIDIDERASRTMGMQRAFTIDAFRLLIVPLDEAWFPNLSTPSQGVRGRAPDPLRRHIARLVDRAVTEREPLLDIYPRRPPPR